MRLKKALLFLSLFMIMSQGLIVFAADNETNSVENTEVNEKLDELNESILAESYVVIDSKTGQKIIGKNETEVMYPASLTKIMTSLLLIESEKLDEMFTVSSAAEDIDEASIYVKEGEEISGKDLLYSMMLQSANDACYVVAEGVSSSVDEFYALMTKRAKEIGASVSNFMSANGLHEENHISSAMDLAMITKEALKHEEFRTVIKELQYDLSRTSEDTMKTITNKNRMLFDYKNEYNQYSIGGKTAFTTPAGNCLMEVAKKDDMEIIVIALKSDSVYEDCCNLINYTFENFENISVIDKSTIPYNYKNIDMEIIPNKSLEYITNNGNIPKIETKIELIDINNNLIEKDKKVGTIYAYLDGELYDSVDLLATEEYEIPVTVTKNLNMVVYVGIILCVFLIIYIVKSKKNIKSTISSLFKY